VPPSSTGISGPGVTTRTPCCCSSRCSSRLSARRGSTSCPQRAFPPVGCALEVDERRSTLAPYPVLQRMLSN